MTRHEGRSYSADTLKHFTPEYITQEKWRAGRLLSMLYPSLSDGQINKDWSLERAVSLFGLNDVSRRVGGQDTFADGEFNWFIKNNTLIARRPHELVVCRKASPFETLMLVERRATVTTAAGTVLSRNCRVDIQGPQKGTFQASVKVATHTLEVKARAHNFATISGAVITGEVKGVFTHAGELVVDDTQK